jgi:hypothetical protein
MVPPPGVRIPELRLDRDGEWYVDGERISHERTCQVLTRNVYLRPEGGFGTSIGREHVPIVVDDVAFFVRSVEPDAAGLGLFLSDETAERQAVPELKSSADGRMYVCIKDGRAWARFSRSAHQALAPLVEEREGAYGLVLGSRFVPVFVAHS